MKNMSQNIFRGLSDPHGLEFLCSSFVFVTILHQFLLATRYFFQPLVIDYSQVKVVIMVDPEMPLRYSSPCPCENIDGLVQERRNSSALAMELRLFCTNPSIW